VEQLSSVAGRRAIEARRLRSELQGDLDRVVMKALEKDRTRRYTTAAALAEDLQHFLDHEPVSARAPGFWYVTRKAAERHRLAFGAAAAVGISLLVGAAVSLAFAFKARELGGRARANERIRAARQCGACVSSAATAMLALSEQREITIWDWRFGQELLRLRTSYLPFASAFSPDGLALAVASYNPGVTVYFAIPWWQGPLPGAASRQSAAN
jgi:hypothetical protein